MLHAECGFLDIVARVSGQSAAVLERGDEFVAIEAKCSDRVRDDAFVGLRKFGEMKNVKKKILVSPVVAENTIAYG